MIDRYQALIDMRDNWHKDAPGIAENNNDLTRLAHAVVRESIEFLEKVLTNDTPEEIADEGADVFWFILTAFMKLGIDLFDAARNKHAYNLFRFGGYFKEAGSYSTDYPNAKAHEKKNNLKAQFNDGLTPIRNQA